MGWAQRRGGMRARAGGQAVCVRVEGGCGRGGGRGRDESGQRALTVGRMAADKLRLADGGEHLLQAKNTPPTYTHPTAHPPPSLSPSGAWS